MARGWESKSVESQMDAAEDRAAAQNRVRLSVEQAAKAREIESIELSRTRVQQLLETATNPKYRDQLEESLRFLEQKLAAAHVDAANPSSKS